MNGVSHHLLNVVKETDQERIRVLMDEEQKKGKKRKL